MLTMAENRVYRAYDRTVKGYEDLAVVAEARDQLDEWNSAGHDANPDNTGGADPSGARQR
jgi:hypothetical protein